MKETTKTSKELLECKEPKVANKKDSYTVREQAREDAYGGKPPSGYSDWGTYWKSF